MYGLKRPELHMIKWIKQNNLCGIDLYTLRGTNGSPFCAEKGTSIHRYKISELNYGVGFS